MNILMPMAGAGRRFADRGYKQLKPLIPTTERRDGKTYPMVICAMHDVMECADSHTVPIFVIRSDYHENIRNVITDYYPDAVLIGVDHLTEGQACTCLLAKAYIDGDDPLLIAGCDNGMVFEKARFRQAAAATDVLVFTYRHNESVLASPNSYGWVQTDGTERVTGVSVKKAISDHPLDDYAIVSSFWFRRGRDFVKCAEEMIACNDRINGEFYVDQVIAYCLRHGLTTKVLEIERYLGWGTPEDYECYEQTLDYWRAFTKSDAFRPRE